MFNIVQTVLANRMISMIPLEGQKLSAPAGRTSTEIQYYGNYN